MSRFKAAVNVIQFVHKMQNTLLNTPPTPSMGSESEVYLSSPDDSSQIMRQALVEKLNSG